MGEEKSENISSAPQKPGEEKEEPELTQAGHREKAAKKAEERRDKIAEEKAEEIEEWRRKQVKKDEGKEP